jgi:hypothetical protein
MSTSVCDDNLTLLTIQPTSKMSTSVSDDNLTLSVGCDDNLTLFIILVLAITLLLLLILINLLESYDKVFDERTIAFGEIETLIAEFDEERETLKSEIEKLKSEIEKLKAVKVCHKLKTEEDKDKRSSVTNGWIVVIGGSAFSGKVGPLSDVRCEPRGVLDRKKVVLNMGLVGYSMRNHARDPSWWPRDQTNDPNKMLVETIKEGHTDTHISPGVSFHLIKDKIKAGFKVEFEDERDIIYEYDGRLVLAHEVDDY